MLVDIKNENLHVYSRQLTMLAPPNIPAENAPLQMVAQGHDGSLYIVKETVKGRRWELFHATTMILDPTTKVSSSNKTQFNVKFELQNVPEFPPIILDVKESTIAPVPILITKRGRGRPRKNKPEKQKKEETAYNVYFKHTMKELKPYIRNTQEKMKQVAYMWQDIKRYVEL